MVQKIGKNQKIYQGWEISGKDGILTYEDKQMPFTVNNAKGSLEMTQ